MTNYSERKVLNNFLIAFVKQKDNLHIYIMNKIPSNILAHIARFYAFCYNICNRRYHIEIIMLWVLLQF